PGTSFKSTTCHAGADFGAGSACHIPYDWQPGRAYQMLAQLVGPNTWHGSITDVATGGRPENGEVTAGPGRGLVKPRGATFAEFFHHIESCAEQPHSEVAFFRAVGYRGGREFPGIIHTHNVNHGCNVIFHGDAKGYVYVDVGQ